MIIINVHNGLPLNFEQSAPPSSPYPSLCSMTAQQNVACGGHSSGARGDLATSSAELDWLATQCQTLDKCYSSRDKPSEQRASPNHGFRTSPVAADATWRPQSLQPMRRRWRAPAGSPQLMSMSCTEKALSAGKQARCCPLLSPFLGGGVTARLHVLCVD